MRVAAAAAAAAAVVLTGCFYLDPIITRPGVFIHVMGDVVNGDMAPRSGHITATAMFDDTKRHGTFVWQALACGPAGPGHAEPDTQLCDDMNVPATEEDQLDLSIPVTTIHGQLVNQVLVRLDARDDRGALATAEESITVLDGPPTLDLTVTSHRSPVIHGPIQLFARFGDPEFAYEDFNDSQVSWMVTPDTPLDDIDLPPPAVPDPLHATLGKRLVPQAVGDYTVTVGAMDPAGNSSPPQQRTFHVGADQPPCLAQWQPIAPPDGQTVPISVPTLFQVPLVTDDLDAYPPISDDEAYGTAAFAWSILAPGDAQRRPLTQTNHVNFDPTAFTPGDLVELRVEVFDRAHVPPLPCDDTAATCAMTSDPSCLQRQTWRIEVR